MSVQTEILKATKLVRPQVEKRGYLRVTLRGESRSASRRQANEKDNTVQESTAPLRYGQTQ